MRDFESYQNAVDVEDKEEYMSSLNRSLSLAMEEFYKYELKTLHLYFNFLLMKQRYNKVINNTTSVNSRYIRNDNVHVKSTIIMIVMMK